MKGLEEHEENMTKRTGGTWKHQAFLCVEVRAQLIAKVYSTCWQDDKYNIFFKLHLYLETL